MKNANWIVAQQDVAAWNLAGALRMDPLLGQMLWNRGIKTPEAAQAFIDPSFSQLHSPSLLPNAAKAAERIVEAVQKKQKIIVFGDYDVDGVTGTTIMFHALKFLGADVDTYIPHRLNEGYGLSEAAIEKAILGLRPGLLISVDCGITAVEPAKVAAHYGVDLIITDHHEAKDVLPECFCIVHPRLEGSQYPNGYLCGAAVAFKVALAIGQAFAGSEKCQPEYGKLLYDLLCFAALGTIADVVPLVGENRAIVVQGLRRLPQQNRFHGLRALLESAGLKDEVDGYAVGFTLAPRLNAAGRMGHADDALRLFTKADYRQARGIATELERKNKHRQETQKSIAEEALAQAEQFTDPRGIVVCGKGWHGGVVGVVASRVVEQFHRPALVLHEGKDGSFGGSGRSVEGFSVADALRSCEHLLTSWGGHDAACGLKLKAENLPAFRLAFDAYCREHLDLALCSPNLYADAEVEMTQLTVDVVKDIKRLGPFGHSNPKPLVVLRNVIPVEPKSMGASGKHLMFRAVSGSNGLKCIAWGEGELAHKHSWDQPADLLVEPQINEWRGRENVELLVRDMKVVD